MLRLAHARRNRDTREEALAEARLKEREHEVAARVNIVDRDEQLPESRLPEVLDEQLEILLRELALGGVGIGAAPRIRFHNSAEHRFATVVGEIGPCTARAADSLSGPATDPLRADASERSTARVPSATRPANNASRGMTVGNAVGENKVSIQRAYPDVTVVAAPDNPTSVSRRPMMARTTARPSRTTGMARMAAATASAHPATRSGSRQP